MNEQPLDELQQVFREAQVDLPPGLKARLLTIPALEPRTASGSLHWLLPLLALIPGFLWVIIHYAYDLYGYAMQLTHGLSPPELLRITSLRVFTLPDLSRIPVVSQLSPSALPTITPLMVLIFTAAVALVAGLAAGLYLWRESQLDLQYLRLLNRIR